MGNKRRIIARVMGNQQQTMMMSNNNNALPEPPVKKTEEEWRKILTPQEYNVCREKGTERAFTGSLYNNHSPGLYNCKCCGEPLFTSDTKYDSGSGWPSFYRPISSDVILELTDNKIPFMTRTEVICAKCHCHLGHVFNDGPRDKTGLRYCINSVSLKF